MDEPSRGPQGRRRGRGARERILAAADRLFRAQGINTTGMDQLCAEAEVSKRTAYQHFSGKDALVTEHLRGQDAALFDGPDDRHSARERLLAVFEPAGEGPTPLCPFVGAAVEIADPGHPGRVLARDYKLSVARQLAEVAREAGATDPDLLGERLALLLDGATTRTRALGAETLPTAAGIAAVLIEQAIPATAP